VLNLRRAMFDRLLTAHRRCSRAHSASSLTNTLVYEVQPARTLLVAPLLTLVRDSPDAGRRCWPT
jgi:ATP-binding cassette, subfamily B, bacterial MsbA